MFAYIKYHCDNMVLPPDTGVAVISFYESVTNLTFLDIYTYTTVSFRIRITNMLLTSSNACNIRTTTFQTLKNKIDELTHMIDFGEFPSLYLESQVLKMFLLLL